jgi:hypothetical protein
MFGIPGLTELKAAIAGGILLAAIAGGFYAGYRWELGAYNGLVAADATALAKATVKAADKQAKIDRANQGDAVTQAYLSGRLDAVIVNFNLEAPANVTVTQDQQAAAAEHAGCITYGFYRMLAAGERGQPADSLNYPSGESADACTAQVPSALAAAVAEALSDGYGDAQQLNSLIGAVKRNNAIAANP